MYRPTQRQNMVALGGTSRAYAATGFRANGLVAATSWSIPTCFMAVADHKPVPRHQVLTS